MFFRFTLLTVILACALYFYSIRVKPEDRGRYEQMMLESLQARTRKVLEGEPAIQKRHHVQKDIWNENEGRFLTITGDSSELTIAQTGDTIHVNEKLHNICCKASNGFVLHAKEGEYIQGSLTLQDPQGTFPKQECHFSAKTLLWHHAKDQINLIDEVKITQNKNLVVMADHGMIELAKFHPQSIVLQGNVQLISSRFQDKESFALADKLHFDPETETLVFSSDKRVLFWQDGLKLSAAEVQVSKDKAVRGLGDVHCHFNLEEESAIERLINHYL